MSKEKPNFTFNFYGSIGQQIANVEQQTVHVGKDGNIQIANVEESLTSSQSPSPTNVPSSTPPPSPSEPYLAQDALFKYIHPSVSTDADKSQITREIQNLVSSFPLPEICRYLIEMKKANRIYLNVKPELAFAELHRMGMPDEQTEGFSYKNFTKYYNVN